MILLNGVPGGNLMRDITRRTRVVRCSILKFKRFEHLLCSSSVSVITYQYDKSNTNDINTLYIQLKYRTLKLKTLKIRPKPYKYLRSRLRVITSQNILDCGEPES